jgi:hypothetical protein
MMFKPSLNDQIQKAARKAAKETNKKIGKEAFEEADITLRACFGAEPMLWEAEMWIGLYRFQEHDENPIAALDKMVSSILAEDLSRCWFR